MKICPIRLVFCVVVLIIQCHLISNLNVLGQQRPPLSVDPSEECHIIEAVPILIESDYKSNGYKLTKLKEKPLIIEESISLGKSINLKIEQRGCEDIYARFDFAFEDKTDRKRGIKLNLRKAAQSIGNLKITKDALLNSKVLAQISKAIVKYSQKANPLNQQVICLDKAPDECISDISLKYRFPHLEILYITRP